MDFGTCMLESPCALMEGALGERLKREYHLRIDGTVAMADLLYRPAGRNALEALWRGYLAIAEHYDLPFLATTPTRRCNRERAAQAGYAGGIIADNVKLLRGIADGARVPRFLGIQANTSALSYAELDGAADLKTSAPDALAEEMLRLRKEYDFRLFGGCCGTDFSHMEELAKRLAQEIK